LGSIFLAVATLGLLFSASAWLPARRIGPFAIVYMMSGWLTGELALQHIAWQALATLGFAVAGAFESPLGIAGLALTFVSWGLLLGSHLRGVHAAHEVRGSLAPLALAPASDVSPLHGLRNPFRMRREDVEWIRDVPYGAVLPGDKGRRNLLDVVRPSAPGERRPALLQIHGGAWVIGDKREQGQPLMTHLASRGWVCFAINYRLSPRATFPEHLIDVKLAIAWIREHIAEYGGDPRFLAVTGGSAGGHLTALTALTANDPEYQPGFESVDTRVQAAVPFYGVYDFTDRQGLDRKRVFIRFAERMVIKKKFDDDRDAFERASPMSRVRPDAPPFLVIHGTHDSLVPVRDARHFVELLRAASQAPVCYVELPQAQHAFEIFHSQRTRRIVLGVDRFLSFAYAEWLARERNRDAA